MKPGDFLIGVFELFAIVLPGSLATWLVVQYIPSDALRDALSFSFAGQAKPDPIVLGMAFLVVSYVLGHFVFMLGSELDPSYDRWRKRTKPIDRDTTFQAAQRLHNKLNSELAHFTTVKWGRAYIQIKAAPARAEIDRLEADQKFFRSMVVVSAAFAAHFLLTQGSAIAGVTAIAMGIFSYRRYLDQRWKMSELIFATAVIAHAIASAPTPTGTTAAGKSE
jgi:hypothetical protein